MFFSEFSFLGSLDNSDCAQCTCTDNSGGCGDNGYCTDNSGGCRHNTGTCTDNHGGCT